MRQDLSAQPYSQNSCNVTIRSRRLVRDPTRAQLPGLACRPPSPMRTTLRPSAAAVRGHAAVVSAFNPGWNEPELVRLVPQRQRGDRDAVLSSSGVKRFLVIGGAGSLFVAPGVQLVDTPEFSGHVPPNIIPGSHSRRATRLPRLRGNMQCLDWTFLSPPAMLRGRRAHRQLSRWEASRLADGRRPAGRDLRGRLGDLRSSTRLNVPDI